MNLTEAYWAENFLITPRMCFFDQNNLYQFWLTCGWESSLVTRSSRQLIPKRETPEAAVVYWISVMPCKPGVAGPIPGFFRNTFG